MHIKSPLDSTICSSTMVHDDSKKHLQQIIYLNLNNKSMQYKCRCFVNQQVNLYICLSRCS
jgi:hypothetical protein